MKYLILPQVNIYSYFVRVVREGQYFDCRHQSYDALDEKVIEAHLRGSIVAGLYPLRREDFCHLLAIDFDDEGWQRFLRLRLTDP